MSDFSPIYANNPSGIAIPLICDVNGRLLSSSNLFNNNAALSISNPAITADQIHAALALGQVYSATTGKQSPAAGGIMAMQLFNPANNTKNILIFSCVVLMAAAGIHDLRQTTADASTATGWVTSTTTILNNKGGGPGSSLSGTTNVTFTNSAITANQVGTSRETVVGGANAMVECFTNGSCLLLPANQAGINGFVIYPNTSGTNAWAVTMEWIEY